MARRLMLEDAEEQQSVTQGQAIMLLAFSPSPQEMLAAHACVYVSTQR